MENYLEIAVGDEARRHQTRRGSLEHYENVGDMPPPAALGDQEVAFLTERDSFYLSSIGENGWPYVQHRGGPPGFVHVVDRAHLVWAERAGNQQFVSAGNTDHDDRISIIAVDYPNRSRLKLYGRAHFDPSPTASEREALGIEGRIEGVMRVEVVAFDWNCPKYITPRYTADEVRAATQPLHDRIAELERRLADSTV